MITLNDFLRKLSSRKFWALLIALAVALLVLFGIGEATIERVSAVLGACGVLAAYIFGEAKVDAARAGTAEEKPPGEGAV